MIALFPVKRPTGAATILGGLLGAMDILLHCGAHRTGTTSFQKYLREGREALKADGTWFWGPRRLRRGIFAGLFSDEAHRTALRVTDRLHFIRGAGAKRLLVSEENMLGAPKACLRRTAIYPDAGFRISRLKHVFGGTIDRIVLTIRPQELWWSSVAAFAVSRGASVPTARVLDRIAFSPRTWRDVVTDIARAAPNVPVTVVPFDVAAKRPDWLYSVTTQRPAPLINNDYCVNASPTLQELRAMLQQRQTDEVLPFGEGRWNPFNKNQRAALREAYADDIMWLKSGANGLATLTEEINHDNTVSDQMWKDTTRGNDYDNQAEQRLA